MEEVNHQRTFWTNFGEGAFAGSMLGGAIGASMLIPILIAPLENEQICPTYVMTQGLITCRPVIQAVVWPIFAGLAGGTLTALSRLCRGVRIIIRVRI